MPIVVHTEPIGTMLHRMLMYNGEKYVGEYERSQKADIERKTAEIEDATTVLLALFEKYGELCVRWDGRKKSIRAGGIEVGFIPKSAWKVPSWQQSAAKLERKKGTLSIG